MAIRLVTGRSKRRLCQPSSKPAISTFLFLYLLLVSQLDHEGRSPVCLALGHLLSVQQRAALSEYSFKSSECTTHSPDLSGATGSSVRGLLLECRPVWWSEGWQGWWVDGGGRVRASTLTDVGKGGR